MLDGFTRRSLLQISAALLGLRGWHGPLGSSRQDPMIATPASSRDPITFTTSWHAQAEHGGFYQALATGIYDYYHLDVTIKMGGAGLNVMQLLAAGATDFAMGTSMGLLHAIEAGIPLVTVAAIFQKDPQCLLAHPDQGIQTLTDLKDHPIYISIGSNLTYWPFLRSQYGFEDKQQRPYNDSLAPFFIDQSAAQQGYITSEPYLIKTEAGFDPVALLLSDYGYNSYDTTIETTQTMVQKRPDLVQRFVEASIEGWYSYLENPAAGNELIKQANPQMTDDFLEFSLGALKKYGIVTSGDAETLGIGAMTETRWHDLFETMVTAKVFKPTTDYQKAFTSKFINQGRSYYLNQLQALKL